MLFRSRMIVVYVDITAPLYWWKEFDTYKVGTVANSCSTMHKIHDKEFTLDDFSHDHLIMRDEGWDDLGAEIIDGNLALVNCASSDMLQLTCNSLNFYRDLFLTEQHAEDKKIDWWQMIQLLPSSYNQKRTVMMSYEVLSNIYRPDSRLHHKLAEWNVCSDGSFCQWIESLPYSDLITRKSEMLDKKLNVKDTWIKIEEGCLMPDDGDEVLVTIRSDYSYGKGTDIQLDVDLGQYREMSGYIFTNVQGLGGFDTINDWDEGQPISIIAWMKRPQAFGKEG